MGTEKAQNIYLSIEKHLLNNGVEILFGTECTNLKFEGNKCCGIYASDGKRILRSTPSTIVATGRRGADWLEKLCAEHNIAHQPRHR